MADSSAKKPDYRSHLTPEQVQVCWNAATERAFTGKYWNSKDPGVYHCVACGQALFDSKTKYESGTGWPSFFQPVKAEAVRVKSDRSLGMVRDEVVCGNCGAHLGHVFDDGPPPTGKRFCMNSAALDLREE